MEAEDMLDLLAGLSMGERADKYESPSERIAELLAEPVKASGRRKSGDARRAEVTAFLLAAGGEG